MRVFSTKYIKGSQMAEAKKEPKEQVEDVATYIVTRKRDNTNVSFVYVCVVGTTGETISTKVPMDVEVELDANVVKSIKSKKDMVRVPAPKDRSTGETLKAMPTYSIEKVSK